MVFRLMVVALTSLIALAAFAEQTPAPNWSIDEEASYIAFSGKQTGKSFTGRFGEFSANIAFFPDALEQSHIRAVIKTDSAATGDRQRDSAMPGKDWFSSKDHPEAIFQSSEISKTVDGEYEAKGTLTLRGVEQELTLPFSLEIDGANASAKSSLTLIRSDFGVGQGEFKTGKWVDLEVGLEIVVNATAKNPAAD